MRAALLRGAHKSCNDHLDFLRKEFVDMIHKGQWAVFPASVTLKLKEICLSPPGVVPQRECRSLWICNYTWSGVNAKTLPLATKEAMQFGHALEQIL